MVTFDRFLQEAAKLEEIAWRKYRRRAARHRVEQRIRELGLNDFAAYLERIRIDAAERAGLADRMRVTVSRFFREREQWWLLAEKILPALLGDKMQSERLRAWSAGCCGGEEPYTLAILWRERVAPYYPGRTVEIIASDIDPASLARAAAAHYEASSLHEVPPDTRARFFVQEDGNWRVSAEAKELVLLEHRNVMDDPLPSGMDLVLCRYLVCTYYRGERLLAAVHRLGEALRPGGVLMVGRKESLPAAASAWFEPLPECTGFYLRRS